jgi:chitin synthase
MIPVSVVRPSARPNGLRGLSRSPSPTLDVSVRNDYNPYDRDEDDEKALLGQERDDYDEKSSWVHSWDQKHHSEDGDISQMPYHGRLSAMPSIHVQSPTTSTTAPSTQGNEPHLLASSTQHFGPAPMGRVSRRTHNAAGHRRIKQKATLDENGFFAVDMPIPTRLAQFLPVKGVEEQKSTR